MTAKAAKAASAPPAAPPGRVLSFYSYKGGVGRSMALANVAAWLARWGNRVLVVDWDLEAPGIEKYFSDWLRRPGDGTGLIQLLDKGVLLGADPLDWRAGLMRADCPGVEHPIHILGAGRGAEDYQERLRAVNLVDLFTTANLGRRLEELRAAWVKDYDFVLVDSRTGVTDIGGVCAIHLPDVLVGFYTPNEQSLEGLADILRRARDGHASLAVDRGGLTIVPVLSRDESEREYELAKLWRERAAETLEDFFNDWLPRDERVSEALDVLKVPYRAYWSFGEQVPVFKETDPDNPKSMAYGFQPLARLLASNFNWTETRFGEQAATAAAETAEERRRQAEEEARGAALKERIEIFEARRQAAKIKIERISSDLDSEVRVADRRRAFNRQLSMIAITITPIFVALILLQVQRDSFINSKNLYWLVEGLLGPAGIALTGFSSLAPIFGVFGYLNQRRSDDYANELAGMLGEADRINAALDRLPRERSLRVMERVEFDRAQERIESLEEDQARLLTTVRRFAPRSARVL